MSLGLRLLAQLSRRSSVPREILSNIEEWILREFREMQPTIRRENQGDPPTLFCRLHPAAENLEISFVNPKEVIASANTTTAGPGYHIFLTSFLKTLAHEFGLLWQEPKGDSREFGDETGFFFTEDEGHLRSEMLSWLQCLAGTFFDGSLEANSKGIALCLPMNPQFESDQPALTPLGPRDREWLERTSQDGREGMDFFAWWDSGFTAEFYLCRALTQMWTDVRWRKPVNDFERRVLEDVASCLESAYQLDPTLNFPMAEWREVLKMLDRDAVELRFGQSRAMGSPSIGYRRGHVTESLPGGWRIRIPGSFSDFESEDEGAMSAIDPPREIWFTAYRQEGGTFEAFQSQKAKEADHKSENVIERDRYYTQASINEKTSDTGIRYFVMNSSNLTVAGRSVCTIVFPGLDQKDWALETWRSLRPPEN
jgi:hypothetical protein